jgi:hypothetical protein
MRYVDINLKEMPEDFNQDEYTVVEAMIPKEGAYDTIDNVTKFALDADNDYEKGYICYPPSTVDQEIEEAKIKVAEENDRKASIDDSICDLYETSLDHTTTLNDLDEAICTLYELTL